MISRITITAGTSRGTTEPRGWRWLTVRAVDGDWIAIRDGAVVSIESGPALLPGEYRAMLAKAPKP